MPHPTLLLIDWQRGFRDLGHWGQRNNPGAEANVARLLAHWRKTGAPVVHVRHDSTEARSPLRPGQPGNAFEDFAQPQPGEPVYAKRVNSAFIGTTLERDLRAGGARELVFCGPTTDHCVNTTVRMAANLGFAATIVSDACFAFAKRTPDGRVITAEDVHDTHLASLSGEFAAVHSTDSLIGG